MFYFVFVKIFGEYSRCYARSQTVQSKLIFFSLHFCFFKIILIIAAVSKQTVRLLSQAICGQILTKGDLQKIVERSTWNDAKVDHTAQLIRACHSGTMAAQGCSDDHLGLDVRYYFLSIILFAWFMIHMVVSLDVVVILIVTA